jgi:hypothetical protein
MAVAVRRSGLTLSFAWVAWIAAAVVAAALVVSAEPGAYIPVKDISGWVSAVVIAAPLALLQVLILLGLLHFPIRAAGLWFGLTLVAAIAAVALNTAWWQIFPRTIGWSIPLSEQGFDISYTEDYFEPLFFGLAQGVVLALILRRKAAVLLWVAVNLVAFALVLKFISVIVSPVPVDYRLAGGPVLEQVVFRASLATITGAALVALLLAWPATAPARAAR